jgi:hypothetical protein
MKSPALEVRTLAVIEREKELVRLNKQARETPIKTAV